MKSSSSRTESVSKSCRQRAPILQPCGLPLLMHRAYDVELALASRRTYSNIMYCGYCQKFKSASPPSCCGVASCVEVRPVGSCGRNSICRRHNNTYKTDFPIMSNVHRNRIGYHCGHELSWGPQRYSNSSGHYWLHVQRHWTTYDYELIRSRERLWLTRLIFSHPSWVYSSWRLSCYLNT